MAKCDHAFSRRLDAWRCDGCGKTLRPLFESPDQRNARLALEINKLGETG